MEHSSQRCSAGQIAAPACGLGVAIALWIATGTAAAAPTPASSAALAPQWPSLQTRSLPKGAQLYAPASHQAERLFGEASAEPSKAARIAGVSLACRVDLGERVLDGQAPFGSAKGRLGDLNVFAAALPRAKQPLRYVALGVGPEDSNTAVVVAPRCDLGPGAVVHLRVLDRDVTFDDQVAAVDLPFTGGLPLRYAARGLVAECRRVEAEDIDRALGPLLEASDRELKGALGALAPADDLASGRPLARRLDAPRRALAEAAALVGWDDPRILPRLQGHLAFEESAAASYRAAFAAKEAAAQGALDWTPLADGQLELRLGPPPCGRSALQPYAAVIPFFKRLPEDACALRIGLRNRTDRTVVVDYDRLGPLTRLRLQGPDGERWVQHLSVELSRGQPPRALRKDLKVPAGGEVELLAAPSLHGRLTASALPLLLEAEHERTVGAAGAQGWLRLPGVALRAGQLDCDNPKLAAWAKEAWVFSSAGPVCALPMELRAEGGKALDVGAATRQVVVLGGDLEPLRVEGWLKGSKRLRGGERLTPGKSLAVLALVRRSADPSAALRVGSRFEGRGLSLRVPVPR